MIGGHSWAGGGDWNREACRDKRHAETRPPAAPFAFPPAPRQPGVWDAPTPGPRSKLSRSSERGDTRIWEQ
eukprot:1985572-Rhodomonas_salina.3